MSDTKDSVRKHFRVTLAQVASKAGVSSATASQVLNNRPNCWASVETRARIHSAARELGYRPNLTARSLRAGRTQSIGTISPVFYIGTHHNRSTGIFSVARELNYAVLYSVHSNNQEQEEKLIQLQLDKGVDGLIVHPCETGGHAELRRLVDMGFPLVTLDGSCALPFDCDDVSADYSEAGKLQATHLLEQGKRRIALANMVPATYAHTVREDAIRQELEKAGLPPPLLMDIESRPDCEMPAQEPVEAAMREFITSHRGQFDALAGCDCAMSLAIRVCSQLGIRIPDDVAVVGAGDSPLSRYGVVPITSVSVNDEWIGETAFKMLIERIEGPPRLTFQHHMSKPSLIVRASTVRP